MESRMLGYECYGYKLGSYVAYENLKLIEKVTAIIDIPNSNHCMLGFKYEPNEHNKIRKDIRVIVGKLKDFVKTLDGVYLENMDLNTYMGLITKKKIVNCYPNTPALFMELKPEMILYDKRAYFGHHIGDIVTYKSKKYKVLGGIYPTNSICLSFLKIIIGAVDVEDKNDLMMVTQKLHSYDLTGYCVEYAEDKVGEVLLVEYKDLLQSNKEDKNESENSNDSPKQDVPKQWSHYSAKGIEPIEYIMRNDYSFNRGNIVKYAHRAGNKKGQEIDDILKIMDYAIFLALEEGIKLTRKQTLDRVNKRFDWIEAREK